MEDKQCEKCEHHDYCAWLYEYQDFGVVCNEYKEQSTKEIEIPKTILGGKDCFDTQGSEVKNEDTNRR